MALRRRTFFAWHSWIGLTAGLLLFVICWSGTVAVFSHELDWLADEHLHAPHAEKVAWQAIHENAVAKHPGWSINQIQAPIKPGYAAEVWLSDPQDVMHRAWADPRSGAIITTTSYFNIQRFFRSFHMSLFIGEWHIWGIPTGYWLVGLGGIVLFASLVTSLLFYKRFWRGFFKLERTKGTKVFLSDLHKLVGLWSLWFVLLISVTGIWYLIEWKVTSEAPYPDPPAVEATVDQTLSVSELVHATEKAYPALEVRAVGLDEMSRGLFQVHGQDGTLLVRDRGARVFLDARNGSPILIQRPSELSALHRWIDTADPLHFGNFGGLWSKTVWFTFGIGISGLCLTGAYLQAKRQQRHGTFGWRMPVIAAYAVTCLTLLASTWFGYMELLSYGTAGSPPGVPAGVIAIIAAFVASSLAALTIWMRVLR